ncbi:MAG TPA: ATP-binding protein [Clostridia bacterium]|nr:ATP-binding protein [Clostridia bacterium]
MDYQKDIILKMTENVDLTPVPRTSVDDLDTAKLSLYLDAIKEKYGPVFLEEKDLLEKLGIISSLGENEMATLAGLLIFGKNPQIFLPQLHVTVLSGNGENATVDKIYGTLPEMKDRTMETIKKRMGKRAKVGYLSGKHVEMPAYPLEAIEEAVWNSLIHRDYDSYALGKYIRIKMTDKYIEIKSPGPLLGDQQKDFNLETYAHSRNTSIVRILQEMGEIRNAGTGVRTMLTEAKKYRLEPPVFESSVEDFTARLGNREILGIEDIRRLEEMNLKIDEDRMAAVSYAMKNGSINNREYQNLNDVNRDEAFRELKSLVDQEVLIQEGTGSGTYYVVNEKLKEIEKEKAQLSFFS